MWAAWRCARSKRSLLPPGLAITVTPGRSIAASVATYPCRRSARSASCPRAYRARRRSRLGALEGHRDAAHRDVEFAAGEILRERRPTRGDELDLHAERLRQRAGQVDVEAGIFAARLVERGEGRIVAGRADPQSCRWRMASRREPQQGGAAIAAKRRQTSSATPTRALRTSGRFQQPLHFADEFAQMEGLRENARVLGRLLSGLSATAAKPVMNITLISGSSSVARRASSMPSISGMTMSVSKQLERLLAQPVVSRQPIVERGRPRSRPSAAP